MADESGEFSTHVRIDISISVTPMTAIFPRQVYLEELAQIKLIKQVLVTLARRNHATLKRC